MRGVVVLVVTGAALILLVANLVLFGQASTPNDPVGRLTPSAAIVRPPGSSHSRPATRTEMEVPDD